MGLLEAIGQGPDEAARETFDGLAAELRTGLEHYWAIAGRILDNSGIVLQAPPADYLAMAKNIFSTLFLYSYFAADIDPARRQAYVAVNQCLRGMVTGCDNILDDEYKQTLDTDLPLQAFRFRSVVDIMVSDRVLFELLLDLKRTTDLTADKIREASAASLRALTHSGAQEASEEGGVRDIPTPEKVLSAIHHFKTGLLFRCPWAVPAVIETDLGETARNLQTCLYEIGMGCQLLDDIVDLPADVRERRYNYVWSTIYHGADTATRTSLRTLYDQSPGNGRALDFYTVFPRAITAVAFEGRKRLQAGLNGLLKVPHQHLAAPLAAFLVRRIGADRFLPRRTVP